MRAAAVLDRAVRRVTRAARLIELGASGTQAADEPEPDARAGRPVLEPAFQAAGREKE
jgi:hypothetical protein